jgi:beta-lactamase class A
VKALTLALTTLISLAPLVAQTPRNAPGANSAPLAGGGTRNSDLQKRLDAELAGSGAVWGVSIRHVERNEGAGVRETEPFQTASVFKLGVLLELFNEAQQGKLRLDERAAWQHPERYVGSGLLVYLQPGLQPTWRDLATLMITISDNAATDMLCDRVGIPNINTRLRALGIDGFSVQACTRDLILRSYGMDPATAPAVIPNLRAAALSVDAAERRRREEVFLRDCVNCSTPAAMSALFAKILAGQAADNSGTEAMLGMLAHQQFNQRMPLYLDARIAHKTGSLTWPYWVANDAGIIYLPNNEHLIITIFSRGTEWEQPDAARKQATAEADERMGRIAKMAYQFYVGR